jgi:hypothetical protein|tara:strand:- start:308 stop:493 length:186 start_codon:yes stop_codon:yes gene_type:complete
VVLLIQYGIYRGIDMTYEQLVELYEYEGYSYEQASQLADDNLYDINVARADMLRKEAQENE